VRDSDRRPSLISDAFLRSLPLFLCGAVFFVAGVVVFDRYPQYGPGAFTLWALLFALGFVSAIGGVASWLLVTEPATVTVARRARPDRGRDEPVRRPSLSPEVPARTDRSDFGRPVPSVRPAEDALRYRPSPSELVVVPPTRAAWDEEAGAELGALAPKPSSEAGSVEDALRDLDGIEQDLAPRPRSGPGRRPSG
jgi:hypothetical protein